MVTVSVKKNRLRWSTPCVERSPVVGFLIFRVAFWLSNLAGASVMISIRGSEGSWAANVSAVITSTTIG